MTWHFQEQTIPRHDDYQLSTPVDNSVRYSGRSSAIQCPHCSITPPRTFVPTIDFYAWAQVNEAGADKIGFVMPDNLTVINPDGIAILKGAPNPSVAEAFGSFVIALGWDCAS